MKTRSRVLGVLALGLGVHVVAEAQAQAPVTLTPTADAYIENGTPATNYGAATTMLVRVADAEGLSRAAYLQFNLSMLPAGTITSARLRVYGRHDATTGSGVLIAARGGANTSTWGETQLNWNNAFNLVGVDFASAPLSTATVTPRAAYYEWNVTALVASRRTVGNVTVALYPTAAHLYRHTFNSKEASANRPQLVVTVGAAPNCPVQSNNTTVPGTRTVNLTHGGHARSYILHVPASYRSTTASALVLDMHGFTSTATTQSNVSGFRTHANSANYIVAFPQGVANSWNAGVCCGDAPAMGVDDVGFLRAVVRDIASRANIDLRRVYATGISNGGMMSNRLACHASDVFAAVAPVAGQLWLNGSADAAIDPALCRPIRPVPVFSINSRDDAIVLYRNGVKTFNFWRSTDQCTGTASILPLGGGGSNRCEHYNTCAGGARVGLCSIPGPHEAPYQQTGVINVPSYVWTNAFQPHTISTNCPGTGDSR